MENVVLLFPLLLLPVNALKNVLRTMEMMDMLMFSFCSKVSKNHVTSLNWTANFCSLHFFHEVELEISFRSPRGFDVIQIELTYSRSRIGLFPHSRTWLYPYEVKIKVGHGATFSTTRTQEEKLLERRKLTGGEWVRHFMKISNVSEINRSQFGDTDNERNENIYDYTSEIYNGLKVKKLHCDNISIPEYYQIVNRVQPKLLFLGLQPSLKIKRKLYLQNFEFFRIQHDTSVTSLNTLLMVNIRHASFSCVRFTNKDFNRFLKLWIKKANTQLETLLVVDAERRVMEDILKGISFRRMDERRERTVPLWKTVIVRNGYLIRRCDGTEATISIHTEHNHVTVFAVWNQF